MSPSSSSLPMTRDSMVGLSPSIRASAESRIRRRAATTASTDACAGVRSSLDADWFIARASLPIMRRIRVAASVSKVARSAAFADSSAPASPIAAIQSGPGPGASTVRPATDPVLLLAGRQWYVYVHDQRPILRDHDE